MAAGKNGAAAEDRQPTERMVFRKVSVLEVPEGVEIPPELLKLLSTPGSRRGKVAQVVQLEAWVECGAFTGSKVGAIEAFAGKAGTPDAKVGDFKAVPARSWKGGVRHSAPPVPLITREMLD